MFCKECGSADVHKRGTTTTADGSVKQRIQCNSCGSWSSFPVLDEEQMAQFLKKEDLKYIRTDEDIANMVNTHDVFVITSAQNDTAIDIDFWESLLNYTNIRKAQLFVIPARYRNPSAIHSQDKVNDYSWPKAIEPYLTGNKIALSKDIKIEGGVHVDATAVNPLSGLYGLTEGTSTIIGHSQLEVDALPVNKHRHPIIMTTTGSISKNNNYSDTKAGVKARIAHTNSAIVVEIDRKNEKFHIRQLVADENGHFYDIDTLYTPNDTFPLENASAIVLGDEHVMFMDESVYECTFEDDSSIVNTLKPLNIIRHDVIDCYTISHHHKKDKVLQLKKMVKGENRIRDELEQTIRHVEDTTPDYATTVMVESNHHNHITKWMNEANISQEVWNTTTYHHLWYLTSKYIEENEQVPNPFELWYEDTKTKDVDIVWLHDDIDFYIGKYLVSMHGDVGPNGARGSRRNLSKIGEDLIIGHSHTPGIKYGCVQVGTSSKRKQEWNGGPSSWMNTHAIIYPNDTYQLINIVDGDWRL